MSKFTQLIVLLLLVITGAALWFNYTMELFIGLVAILLIMSWASIIDSLRKK